MQAVGQKSDEDMGFDALLILMIDRSDGQVALEVLKGLFDLRQLQIECPQLGGIVGG